MTLSIAIITLAGYLPHDLMFQYIKNVHDKVARTREEGEPEEVEKLPDVDNDGAPIKLPDSRHFVRS
jgi:hypothetical protein